MSVLQTVKLPYYPTNIFVLKISSAFIFSAYIQVHLRLDFIMEGNIMNPYQNDPMGAV